MNFITKLWLKLRGNPLFVIAWTAFAGALVSQLTTDLQEGKVDFSPVQLQKMLTTAAIAAGLAILHLYTPQQNPTVPATFPPSTTKVEVPAQLEPVDPKAVAANPTKP